MCKKKVTFEKLRKLSLSFFTEMNGSTIMLSTADFTSWRMYHILDQTPTEVTFLGQRESYYISIVIYPTNPIHVCEIEVAGRVSIFSAKKLSIIKNDRGNVSSNLINDKVVFFHKAMCLLV